MAFMVRYCFCQKQRHNKWVESHRISHVCLNYVNSVPEMVDNSEP